MRCIIVDDEPLAREGIQMLVSHVPGLELIESFSSADAAALFLANNTVDIVFLDIQMPGITGIEFAKQIPPKTLVIFTTAYAEYALDSYEVDAIDYLIKPVKFDRFQKAVNKAAAYLQLLNSPKADSFDTIEDYFFVKADRRVFKIYFKDILFIEGLKDYVILHTDDQKIITAMNIKTIFAQLPANIFARVSKSYVVNTTRIQSFDNNTVFLGKHEIPIGNTYRTFFFDEFVSKRMLNR
ncbi:MAG: DNA-binding response regulator [Bacteroidetes bacterium 43-93]|nr:response regulator transcription factor [Bacteroidota bacterium]OJX01316.1 MAG: DNA-binding response regulator [Bacteroidetes bacterium 43-93]